MSYLGVNHDKCILCGVCVDSCPFGALKITGKLEVLTPAGCAKSASRSVRKSSVSCRRITH